MPLARRHQIRLTRNTTLHVEAARDAPEEGRGGSSDFTKAEGRWRDVAAPPTKASLYTTPY